MFDKAYFGEIQATLVKKYIESDIATQLKNQAQKCEKPIYPAVLDLFKRVNEYLDQQFEREL